MIRSTMKNIIVTGGAGYIGSHICMALNDVGYCPIVIDNLSRGHREFVRWGPLIEGDTGNRNLLRDVFKCYKPQAVIHCAGYISVHESVLNPNLYFQNNVSDSLILLQEMLHSGIDKIIFSSSCAVYGQGKDGPLSEMDPPNPISPYGRSKWMFEQMIQDVSRSYSFRHGILRYFNAAGADFGGAIGERHYPETHLIPLIFEAANGQREKFSMFGCDFPTADGSAIRDFIHVSDLAIGHIKALQLLEHDSSSFILNLGAGTGVSVKEMVRLTEQITKKKIPIHFAGRREGDPAQLVADISQAKQRLEWAPQTSIEDIIATAWKWHLVIQ
jgi:UDP-glucose 4-epimerase